MQKLTVAKTVHGYFLALKHVPAKQDESDSETEEETDEDDYNIELGDQNLSSSGSQRVSVNRTRLKKITGRVLALIFFFSCCVFIITEDVHS